MTASWLNYLRATHPATSHATEALKRGPLVRSKNGRAMTYTDGRRGYSPRTIKLLVDGGTAVRIGTGVVHVDYIKDAIVNTEDGDA